MIFLLLLLNGEKGLDERKTVKLREKSIRILSFNRKTSCRHYFLIVIISTLLFFVVVGFSCIAGDN